MLRDGSLSMKKVFFRLGLSLSLALGLAMTTLFSAQTGIAEEAGLHDVAKEILRQCTCRYEREQLVKDQLVNRMMLLANILCDCGAIDIRMAVACRTEAHDRPEPKECALDNSISLSKTETAWPEDWPSHYSEKVKLKEGSINGMGTER